MDVCLLWVLCVVRYRSLRRAGPSSRWALPSVVCLKTVWSWSLEKWGGLGLQGAVEPLEGKKNHVQRRQWRNFSSYDVSIMLKVTLVYAFFALGAWNVWIQRGGCARGFCHPWVHSANNTMRSVWHNLYSTIIYTLHVSIIRSSSGVKYKNPKSNVKSKWVHSLNYRNDCHRNLCLWSTLNVLGANFISVLSDP
jgi:hypothetical protein